MCWTFGIMGLLLGGLSEGIIGAFFGTVIGLGLALLILYMDKRASVQWTNLPNGMGITSAGRGHAAMQAVVSPPPATLREHVARFEHEVSLLRRQLAEIRGRTFAALADVEAAAVELPPIATEALPVVESLAVPVPASQVSVPQSTS